MSTEDLVEKKKTTCSTLFLVRILGVDPKGMRKHGFLNAYLKDVDKELDILRPVYLLFKPKSVIEFNDFLDEARDLKLPIVAEYDYEDGYTVIVMECPEEFGPDYDKVVIGQYSKTSQKYQELFPAKQQVKYGDPLPSFWHNVFNKGEILREHWESLTGVYISDDMEFWTTPDLENTEVLNIEKIKKQING